MMAHVAHPRIFAAEGEDGLYHCMSRIVGGAFLLGSLEKETFIGRMWKLADFLGIEVLDYTVMSNHYHQLVRVSNTMDINDSELLRRVRDYYGEASREARKLEKALAQGGSIADENRDVHLKRMGSISEFQKHLKQGFTDWYNRRNERRGTLWMERFKSLLVEDTEEAKQIIAAYIELNAVRAEMVNDPKNYRYCGYAAALAGDARCRSGIMRIINCEDWDSAAAKYRTLLIIRGSSQATHKKGSISRKLLLETLEANGHLPTSELLRLRIRYFSEGLVLGSERYVEKIFHQFRSHFGERRKSGARPLQGLAQSGLNVIHHLKSAPIT